jgi:dipeptidyl aminopeptidase/acylaminoacyl peptidase
MIASIPASLNGHVSVGTYFWRGKRSMLYDINSLNGVRTLVADLPHERLEFVVQHDETPRFAYGVDENFDAIVFRRDGASGQWKAPGDDVLGRRYVPLGFTPDDKEAFVLYSKDGEPDTFLRESLESGKRSAIAQDPFGNIDVHMYTARPRMPFAVGTSIGRPQLRYVDAQLPDAKLHKDLAAQFPDATVSSVNFSDDGKRLLFWVGSDRDPGSYYLFDRDTGVAQLLFANMEAIDPQQMAARRPIRFGARDGSELDGYLTVPEHPAGKRLPMVVLPHGGPIGVRDSWYFDTEAQFLASRGYAVLQVNFRGSDGRGIAFEHAGFRQWGGKMIDDLLDGVHWAARQPDIDGSRVCTFGASFGAYAALMLPIREPARFKCAAGFAGPYDLARIYDASTVRSDEAVHSFFRRAIGEDREELRRFSPAMQAEKIGIPVLLIHGEKDETVSVDHSDRMQAALAAAGNTPEYMRVAKEGHGFYNPVNQAAYLARLEAFLKKHLGQ